MRAIPDSEIIGRRFGRLVGVRFAGSRKSRRYFLFRCDCGKEKEVALNAVRIGSTTSCGCYQQECMEARSGTTALIHGEAAARTPEYRSWRAMRTRCENSNHHAFANYGGRGIHVCERWKSYENFLADMGRRPNLTYTLDRIDHNGNYEPSNCRWASKRQQLANRRVSRMIHCDGERICIAEAARRKGLSGALIRYRLENGWSEADALLPAGAKRHA